MLLKTLDSIMKFKIITHCLLKLYLLFFPTFTIPNTTIQSLSQSTTTIDVNRDLIKLKISKTNLKANDSTIDAGPILEKVAYYAQAHQIRNITVPKGNYYFKTIRNNAHLNIKMINNLSIKGVDANFFFYNRYAKGILIESCNSFNIEGINLDYKYDLPFSSGIITGIENNTISFNQFKNRPVTDFNNEKEAHKVWIFVLRKSADGVKYITSRMSSETSILQGGKVTVTDKDNNNLSKINKNDIICFSDRSLTANHALCIVNYYPNIGDHNSIKNINIYSSPAMGVAAKWQKYFSVSNVTVKPLETREQYISTNADGIDIANGGLGNSIKNCHTKMTGDDGISYYCGLMGKIVSANQNSIKVYLKYILSAGQEITIANANNLQETDHVIIKSISRLAEQCPETGFEGVYNINIDNKILDIPINSQLFLAEKDRMPGVSAQFNTVEQSYARGIFVAGVTNSEINNNLINETNSSAILIQRINESGNGMKSATCSNINIHDNINNKIFTWGISYQTGAIEAAIMRPKNMSIEVYHKAIKIKNNTISIADNGNKHIGIFLSNISKYAISDNTVKYFDNKLNLPPSNKKMVLENCNE